MTAKAFYGIIAVSTLIGIALGFTAIDPIKAVTMLMAARTDIMGEFVISTRLKVLSWLATLMMALAVCAMLVTMRA
ncbi:hypothetical protein [Cupriavidus sp. M-11]|uniref:hypothetical protein n=1 Tax=Cupriavidus sp. M-11 TaxID=3233038 RepID=UPI003F9132C2